MTNTMGTGAFGVDGRVKVTSTAGSVAGDNNYQGLIVGDANFDNQARIDQAFSSIPTGNLFKATAGEPFTITMEIFHKFVTEGPGTPPTTHQVFIGYFDGDNWDAGDWYNGSIRALRGKHEQANLYDEDVMLNRVPGQQYVYDFTFPELSLSRKSVLTRDFTFPVGTERGWIVMGFVEHSYTVYNQNKYTNLVILPFVVEGPKLGLSEDDPVPILATFREPAVPQLILHNPPGDLSTVSLENSEETCRSIGQKMGSSEDLAANIEVTLGIAGQVGMFVTTEFEFSASISASAGVGQSTVRSNGEKNCLKVVNTISTAPGVAEANEGSIYMGYSSDIAYGEYPTVIIADDLTIETEYRPMFGLVPDTAAPFYYRKNDILDEMQTLLAIENDTEADETVRNAAGSQRDVWQQVLDNDSANIADLTNEVIQNEFTFTGASGAISNSSTVSLTTTSEINANQYIDLGLGTSFVFKVGGSGVSGGVNFKTKKTFGQSVANSNGTSTTIKYSLQDNDAGDKFRVKIVKDPTYGTPIFVLNEDEGLTQSSWPYEGGYQRDQPIFEIVGTASDSTTISNVSLGTSGSFLVRACNGNTYEARDYDFGFLGQSVLTDLKITSAGSEGNQLPSLPITKFLKVTDIPAGGCKASYFDINMSRRDSGSEMAYSDIEFQLFAENEPSISSSLFASINWAGPPPPSDVNVSPGVVCNGSSPVTLTATCPVSTTTTWYNVIEGGFPLATGDSLFVTPTSTTTYYVGCETPDYRRDRVGVEVDCDSVPLPDLIFDNGFESANE